MAGNVHRHRGRVAEYGLLAGCILLLFVPEPECLLEETDARFCPALLGLVSAGEV